MRSVKACHSTTDGVHRRVGMKNATVWMAAALVAFAGYVHTAAAHDTWVQTNTNVVRGGDVVHVDLMLGNHGNEHRDFKLASKITLDPCTLAVVAPGGKSYDLKPNVVDTGYAPKEGYWSARFVPGDQGLHMVAHTLDTLHRTTRAIKSGKTFFVASQSLDRLQRKQASDENQAWFAKPLGHPLEIVPTRHPVLGAGPGQPIAVQVLYQGKPLAGARVSFIPRGAVLAEGFDDQYERTTDDQGRAQYTPTEGNYVLVVVHHREPEQRGEGYDQTAYSATLVVYVPQTCPCCDE
jgi:uncharacterized GH25 family protein